MTLDELITSVNPVILAVVGFLLVLAGLALLVWRAYNLLRATDDRLWATARGFIAQKYIKEETRTTYDEDTGRREEHTVRFPHLVYSFNAQGNAYDSSTIVMGAVGRISRRVYNRYQKGQEVTVYYDPNNPKVSHIEKPGTAMLMAGVGLGGVMTITGMVMLALGVSEAL